MWLVFMAMRRPVTVLVWESFCEGWVTDVTKQLKLKDARVVTAPYGELPDLSKIDPAVEGSPTVGHIYVEYMIPQRLRHRYPVVMVHGGSQTGTNFTGTPDGRDGWAQFIRRNNIEPTD